MKLYLIYMCGMEKIEFAVIAPMSQIYLLHMRTLSIRIRVI